MQRVRRLRTERAGRALVAIGRPALAVALGLGTASSAVVAAETAWDERVQALLQQGQLEDASRLAEIATQEPSDAASAYSWLGRISMAAARFAEAAERFAIAKDLGASPAEIGDPWSTALLQLGRRREACGVLREASGADSKNGSLRYRTGACFLRVNAHGEALPHLEAAARLGISHGAAQMDLARARLATGREEVAVEQLLGMAAKSEEPETLMAIGKLLFERVLYRQALGPLAKGLKARPGWREAGMYLALAHYQLEEYEDCLEVLSNLTLEARSAEALLLRGSALARLGRPEDARRALEGAITMAPERADGYLNMVLFLLEHGLRQEALGMFERAAVMDARGAKVLYTVRSRTNCRGLTPPSAAPDGNPGVPRQLIEFADTLLAARQWGSALEVYLAALSVHPLPARPYGGIGLVCQELGTVEVGMAYVLRGLELHPANPELHYYRGSLQEYLGQPHEAIESYRTALDLAGKAPPRYWLRLGLAQLAAGLVEEAESSFQTALAGEPSFAEAHYRLGRLRLRNRQFAEAERLFERATQLDPSLTEAFYSWGLACIRNGKSEKGRAILEAYRRKLALRDGGGMR
ncbi:MAG: tetratricopeptide repeat protein [Bryobacterales bacterium]|nr:tetratricopeptide repeat protein [Bryobacterales bacterium]